MAELPPPRHPTADAIFAAREREAREKPPYRAWGISASSLGNECSRRLWYDIRWATAPELVDGKTLRIFERGEIEEQRVVEDLRRAGLEVAEVDPDTGRQWRFALARGFIRGKLDGRAIGVIEAPRAEHVIEIKCLNAKNWRAVQKHGLQKQKPDHWHQLHIGMHAFGIQRGIYIAVNADTQEIYTERVKLDVMEASRQEGRVEALIDDSRGPVRSGGPDDFICRFCPHAPICHEAELPERNCRTCVHFTLTREGAGHCARFDEPRGPKIQAEGADCPVHLFLPGLLSWEQIDADPEAETITYRRPDGSEWVDGGQP